MIEIKNLTKKYGELTVYNNFNLSLEENKVTCILGESGSGKTTLLNCIARLTAFTGEITKVKCSYVFQTPRLVPNLTVYGNLALTCGDEDKIYKILEEVELSDKAQAYPARLSGGQAQRVSLARAFLRVGGLMLLDEPFSSLDLKLKYKLYALFKKLCERNNTTALFVTHDIDEALQLADRLIVIKDGACVLDGCADGTSRERVISALLSLDNNFGDNYN